MGKPLFLQIKMSIDEADGVVTSQTQFSLVLAPKLRRETGN